MKLLPPTVAKRFTAGLLAGEVALAVNLAILGIADEFGIATAHGGLLRLATMIIGLPEPGGEAIRIGFHIVVGLGMAMIYAAAAGWAQMRYPVMAGVAAAVVIWLVNAVIVLPLTGEGLAGSRQIGLVGMIWFAVAHTLFFLVLAVLLARLTPVADAHAVPGVLV